MMMNRNNYYDRYKRDKRLTEFYKSISWKQLREAIYKRDHGLCQWCLKDDKFIRADVVHHIVEVKAAWDKRLDATNLVSICHACHNKEHNQKKPSHSSKIKVIKG